MKLRKLIKQLLGHIPQPSPTGVAQFNAWVEDFKATYDLPTKDQDTILNVLASLIINSPSLQTKRSNAYFYRAFVAGAQKQVAGEIFYEIQKRHNDKKKAEKEAANAQG